MGNFSGQGRSFETGGRWNPPGEAVVYFAASPSVAVLEVANYLRSPRGLHRDIRLGTYQVADGVGTRQWSLAEMPDNWRDFPYPHSTQEKGGEWLAADQEALLIVPSAAVPGGAENIAVLNPFHKDAAGVKLIKEESEIFTNRIFTGIE